MIREAVERGAEALVISAVDYNANAEAVDQAAKKGLQIVVIDSDVNSSGVVSRIGTNNDAAGEMAARALLDGEEEVLLRPV